MRKFRIVSALALALVFMFAAILVPAPAQAQGGDSVTVTARVLNVRSGPGLTYGVISAVRQGDVLTVLQRDAGGWLQVRRADGRKAG